MARSKRDYKKFRTARGFDEEDLASEDEVLLGEWLDANPPAIPKDRPPTEMELLAPARKRQERQRITAGAFLPRFTRHARQRSIERNIAEFDVRYLLRNQKGRQCTIEGCNGARLSDFAYSLEGRVPGNRHGKLRLIVSPIESDPKSLLIQTVMWMDEI